MFRKKNNNKLGRRPIYTAPAEVFSYHSHRTAGEGNRRAPGQPARQPVRPGRWLGLLPSLISAAVIAGSIIYSTSLSSMPRLQVNSIRPAPLLRESSLYEAEIARILKDSVFNYSKLTINTQKLARDIKAKYPELGNVSVIIPLSGRRPVIEVKPAEAVLKLSGNGGIFIVDEQGRALIGAEEAMNSKEMRIPYVVDQTGLQMERGRQVLPYSTVEFIRTIAQQMEAKGLAVESVILPPLHNELHLRVTGVPYYGKFDTLGSARDQAGTFIASHAKLQADGTIPSEYIDVRVPEKAFYR